MLLLEPGCGYLFSVCWSVTRPLVFAVGTGDGQLLIYDLKVRTNTCSMQQSSLYYMYIWPSLRAYNLCSECPMSKLTYAFSSSLKDLSNDVCRSEFCNGSKAKVVCSKRYLPCVFF